MLSILRHIKDGMFHRNINIFLFLFFQFDRKNRWSKWWKRVSLSKDIWDHIRLDQVSHWYARLMEVSRMTNYLHNISSNWRSKVDEHWWNCSLTIWYPIPTQSNEWILIYTIAHHRKVYINILGSKSSWMNSLAPLFAECPREKRFCLHLSADDSAVFN